MKKVKIKELKKESGRYFIGKVMREKASGENFSFNIRESQSPLPHFPDFRLF